MWKIMWGPDFYFKNNYEITYLLAKTLNLSFMDFKTTLDGLSVKHLEVLRFTSQNNYH